MSLQTFGSSEYVAVFNSLVLIPYSLHLMSVLFDKTPVHSLWIYLHFMSATHNVYVYFGRVKALAFPDSIFLYIWHDGFCSPHSPRYIHSPTSKDDNIRIQINLFCQLKTFSSTLTPSLTHHPLLCECNKSMRHFIVIPKCTGIVTAKWHRFSFSA